MSIRTAFDMQQVVTADCGCIRIRKQRECVTGFAREVERDAWFVNANSNGTYTGLLEFWKLLLYAS